MNISQEIKSCFLQIILKINGKNVVSEKISLEFSENEKFGDYSTSFAMKYWLDFGFKNSQEFAIFLTEKLRQDKRLTEIVSKIDMIEPGFINFWLKKEILTDNLEEILKKKEKYGISQINKGKIAIVEYSSPNIAKPFTIGHLRSTIIGDAIASLLQATGWKVYRDNHLGDWGTQFGKMIYAIKAWGNEEEIAKSKNPVKDLVVLYVKFHEQVENNPYLEDEARQWFKKLEDGNGEAKRLWQKCVDWSWLAFDKIYSKLGVVFSYEFENGRGLGESFFENKIKAVIDELEEKKLLKTGEKGAKLVFFEKDKYPPAMILKKDGATLYHTRDLATDKYRLEKYNPDLIINEVGAEQTLYFQQLFEMEKLLGWYKDGQRVHIGHGLIKFKEGKMSTRKGNAIWMEEVLEEAQKKAIELGSRDAGLADIVSIGALKYNDLKREPKTEIVFNWEEILNMKGDSGPYLQYVYARCQSVLEKAKMKNKKIKFDEKKFIEPKIEELLVLRWLTRFPEVLIKSAEQMAPNLLCNYLFQLCQKFNLFYQKCQILDEPEEQFRLSLTNAVGQVIKNGLLLLGIQVPEKM
ncbi:MAG: arginine--tRNA ligase [Parcubacteria group bacterium CG_4_10_14_0_2_um_filter_7_35_8]|nr:MAG: arginine--tRNA ligase [Parcubacteria group bacterium CG_4_10_14_0_2_um_filter_7_35_8]